MASFPMKRHWREETIPELLRRSAGQLVALADKFGCEHVVLPRHGCGNGRLSWEGIGRPWPGASTTGSRSSTSDASSRGVPILPRTNPTRKETPVNDEYARDFACAEMLEESETLKRVEAVGPFVVALVRLAGGGYENRVAQPAVIHQNRRTRLPLVNTVETYGPSRYRAAARRFNFLVDEELA